MKREAVITGVGCLSSLGNDPDEFCQNVKRRLEQSPFQAAQSQGSGNGRIKNFRLDDQEILQKYPGLDISCRYILQAAKQAVEQAGITPAIINNYRVGVIIGSTFGLIDSQAKFLQTLYRTGKGSPLLFQQTANNLLSGVIAYQYHMDGLNMTLYNGWTAGLDAVILASQFIIANQVDLMVIGAVDILNETIDFHYQYKKEFTKKFLPAEGAGVLILEGSEIAAHRSQKIIGRLSGNKQCSFGNFNDYQVALENIIDDFGCVCYFANKNGTKLDDFEEEIIAAKKFEVIAIKYLMGECGAASGILEIIYALNTGKKSLVMNAALGEMTAVMVNN